MHRVRGQPLKVAPHLNCAWAPGTTSGAFPNSSRPLVCMSSLCRTWGTLPDRWPIARFTMLPPRHLPRWETVCHGGRGRWGTRAGARQVRQASTKGKLHFREVVPCIRFPPFLLQPLHDHVRRSKHLNGGFLVSCVILAPSAASQHEAQAAAHESHVAVSWEAPGSCGCPILAPTTPMVNKESSARRRYTTNH